MAVRFVYISFLIVLLASCTSINYLTIDVKKPAEVTIDPQVTKIAVVSNFAAQPETFGHKAYTFNRKEKDPQLSTDSLGPMFVDLLSDKLSRVGRIEVVNREVESNKSFYDDSSLTSAQLQQISDSTKADLVISIDRFLVESTIRLDFSRSIHLYKVAMDARANPALHLYDVRNGGKSQLLQSKDTLYWENFDIDSESAISRFPSLSDCFHDLVNYSSDRVMKKLFPHFEKATRFYYSTSNLNLKDAVRFVKEGKWEEATAIWQYFYENSKSKKLKGYCALNMALSSEMVDDYDKAIEWCDKATSLLNQVKSTSSQVDRARIAEYKKELQQRQKLARILDKQF